MAKKDTASKVVIVPHPPIPSTSTTKADTVAKSTTVTPPEVSKEITDEQAASIDTGDAPAEK